MDTNTATKPRPSGSLLADLEYIPEDAAAVEIGVKPKTMKEYRRLRIGPEFSEVGRRFMYSRANLRAWLAAGGKRGK